MALRSKKKRGDEPEGEEPEAVAQDETTEDEALAAEREETDEQRIERERGEYLDAWQRARADYQNLRRRLQTDIDAAVGRAKESMLLELLLVLDFMDMALAAPVESQEAQNLKYGVEMTRNQMVALLEREGVKPIATDGPFDPRRHDALEVIPSDDHEDGAIVEVTRQGYTIADRTLRAAQVKVAGTPEREADGGADSDAGTDDDAAEARD